MKKLLLLGLIFAIPALAQIVVPPNGSASAAKTPPIGTKKSGGNCIDGSCMEFVIKPYCFGTNLRAYAADSQLKPDEDVSMKFNLVSEIDSSKTDELRIEYPARLTFPSEGVRTDCTFKYTNNGDSSPKNILCTNPQSGVVEEKTLMSWKVATNPGTCYAGGGSHGAEYCSYAAIQLSAGDVECLYKFDDQWKIKTSVVSCYYESTLADDSSAIKVFLGANDITSSVKITAHTNKIQLEVSNSLNSLSTNVPVVNGQVELEKNPLVTISYGQGGREIKAIEDSAEFDHSNANTSYTVVVKHPGTEGFCGGFYSPLMLFFDKSLPKFSGVSLFQLHGMKPGQRVNWPEAYAPGYFLVDLKGKKSVESDSQLFGKNGVYNNGFEKLALHDKNKDGKIDKKDKVFSTLKLWNDKNGNGISEASELVALNSKGVESINVKYNSLSPTKFGNRARAKEKSKFTYKSAKGRSVAGDIFDVWLAPIK